MSLELLAAFLLFAAVMLFTPGPNNIMLMTSGLNFGFARTLPHMLGVSLGFGLMVFLVGIGLGEIFKIYPPLYTVLIYGGAPYLVHLARRPYHLCRAHELSEERHALVGPVRRYGYRFKCCLGRLRLGSAALS